MSTPSEGVELEEAVPEELVISAAGTDTALTNQSIQKIDWDHFVSNRQVLRRGLLMNSSAKFLREQTLQLADALVERAPELSHRFKNSDFVKSTVGVEFEETRAVLYENKKVLVDLPTFAFMHEDRRYELSTTCTVCQGELHSKLWSKITYYPEASDFCHEMSDAMMSKAFEFYKELLNEMLPDAELEKKHSFEIQGAYSSDSGIIDVFNILMRNRLSKPENEVDIIDEMIESRKSASIGRLFWFADRKFKFDSDAVAENLRELWTANNVITDDKMVINTVVPMTVNQNDGLFLVNMDRSAGTTRAWGLCHADTIGPDADPQVEQAAGQLTAKLASRLAANI